MKIPRRALMARRGHRRTVHRTETPRTTQQCDIDTTTAFAVPTACSTCVPDSGSVRRCRRASVRTECRTEMECETRGFIKWLSPIYMMAEICLKSQRRLSACHELVHANSNAFR